LKLSGVNLRESISHDTNEHVETYHNQHKTTQYEKYPAYIASQWPVINSINVEFSEHHQPYGEKCIKPFRRSILHNNWILTILIHESKHVGKSCDYDQHQEEEYLDIDKCLPYESYEVSSALEQSHPVERFNPHEEATDGLENSQHLNRNEVCGEQEL
jgi:hypothetical protein